MPVNNKILSKVLNLTDKNTVLSIIKRYKREQINYFFLEGIKYGNLIVVQSALELNTNWNVIDNYNDAAYLSAIKSKNKEIRKLCYQNYILPSFVRAQKAKHNKNLLDKELLEGIKTNNIYLACAALTLGASPNAITKDGYSAIFLSFKYCFSIFGVLVAKGAKFTDRLSEYYHYKILGLKLGLKGLVSCEEQIIPMEGFTGYSILLQVENSLKGFLDNCKDKKESLLLLKVIENFQTLINKEALSELKYLDMPIELKLEKKYNYISSEMNILRLHLNVSTGIEIKRCSWTNHALYIVIDWDNNRVAICNRGLKIGNENSGVTIFENVDFSNVDTAQVSVLIEEVDKDMSFYLQLLKVGFGIDLDNLNNNKFINYISMSQQISGNCSWASAEAAILALLYLNLKKNGMDDLSSLIISKNVYNRWHSYDKEKIINDFFKYCLISSNGVKSQVSALISMAELGNELSFELIIYIINAYRIVTQKSKVEITVDTKSSQILEIPIYLIFILIENNRFYEIFNLYKNNLISKYEIINALEGYYDDYYLINLNSKQAELVEKKKAVNNLVEVIKGVGFRIDEFSTRMQRCILDSYNNYCFNQEKIQQKDPSLDYGWENSNISRINRSFGMTAKHVSHFSIITNEQYLTLRFFLDILWNKISFIKNSYYKKIGVEIFSSIYNLLRGFDVINKQQNDNLYQNVVARKSSGNDFKGNSFLIFKKKFKQQNFEGQKRDLLEDFLNKIYPYMDNIENLFSKQELIIILLKKEGVDELNRLISNSYVLYDLEMANRLLRDKTKLKENLIISKRTKFDIEVKLRELFYYFEKVHNDIINVHLTKLFQIYKRNALIDNYGMAKRDFYENNNFELAFGKLEENYKELFDFYKYWHIRKTIDDKVINDKLVNLKAKIIEFNRLKDEVENNKLSTNILSLTKNINDYREFKIKKSTNINTMKRINKHHSGL